MMKSIDALAALTAMGMAACVSKPEYDRAVADGASAQQSLQYSIEQSIVHEERNREQIADLKTELERSRHETDSAQGDISRLKLDSHNTSASLAEQMATNEELHSQLARVEKSVEQLLADKNAIAKSLDEARQRMEESRRAEARADAQAALARDVAAKLKPMIDAGELTLASRDGLVILELSCDLLFNPRKPELRPAGASALRKVAAVLRTLPGQKLQVAGQADRKSVPTSRFSSHLKWSAAEAAAVIDLLVKEGVPADTLSAAAYLQDAPPVASESKSETSTSRIDIMILPPVEGSSATPRSKS
jgi:flagellar motor protein MotB